MAPERADLLESRAESPQSDPLAFHDARGGERGTGVSAKPSKYIDESLSQLWRLKNASANGNFVCYGIVL